MAVSAATAQKFPQSIRRASEMLVDRIGARRIALENLRDQVVDGSISQSEARRLAATFSAMLREVA